MFLVRLGGFPPIDLGPGAGTRGGEVVAQGTAEELARSRTSVTGRFLRAPLRHPLVARRAVPRGTPCIEVQGADLHNLKKLNAKLPLQRLTVITGLANKVAELLTRLDALPTPEASP